MDLKNRCGIVTGPAKGMGAAVTRLLAEQGADLLLAGRDTAAIEPVADTVRALGRRAVVVGCDVTSEADVAAMARAALDTFAGRIDLLVNIAGGSGPLGRPIWENALADFEQIMTLNVTGCFLTMRAVLPTMIAQRYGKVVNVGGTFGLRGRAGRAAYSTSKWALRGLTKSALEAGPFNVNINCVCPGMVEGERFDRVRGEMGQRLGITPDEARDRMAGEYAMHRISTADDVANAVLFLASDRSRQITGQDLAVDGGWVI